MPIVPDSAALAIEDSAVTLARYQQIIQYAPCAFWGVRAEGEEPGECLDLWRKDQRDTVAKYLAEAQQELEERLGYFLMPRWVTGAPTASDPTQWRFVDERPYRPLINSRWMRLLDVGQRAETVIAVAAVVDHTTDPAVIGPLATTVTDINEIHIYHPGTDFEITPSAIEIAVGNLTIRVPRCRLVTPEAYAAGGAIEYDDVGNCATNPPTVGSFACTVEVRRVYNDSSVNATLVWPHGCSASCSACGCSGHTETACLKIQDARLGKLIAARANFTDGEWRAASGGCCTGRPTSVRLYYLSGEPVLSAQAEDAIVRLAHSKMPNEPCGCEISQRLWQRDRNVPPVVSRERLNCPFGLNDGAWIAWRWCQDAMRQTRGSTL